MGKIKGLLVEGFTLKKIAKLTKSSYIKVYKLAKKYEREGLIYQISKYPLIYAKKKQFYPPLKVVGDFTPANQLNTTKALKALILPKKFGATFYMKGRPKGLKYNSRGIATIKEIDHTAQLGRKKAIIWLKAFTGSTPDECLNNAQAQIIETARQYEISLDIKLTLIRIFKDTEWVITSKNQSKKIADKAGIGEGGQIRVGDAIHKYKDSSDPYNMQFNSIKHDSQEATDHARTHHYLYTRLPSDLKKMEEILDKLTYTIIGLNVKMDNMEFKKRG